MNLLDSHKEPNKAGQIYPPIVSIEYGYATKDDLDNGKEVEVEVKVSYRMDMREEKKKIEVMKNLTQY